MAHGPPRLYAIVPAAGHSRRMGKPKLLLPLGNQTVIERMISSLRHPLVTATCVIVRRDDLALQKVVEGLGATCVIPSLDPPDMRQSVECGLNYVRDTFNPIDGDGWLLCPADHPVLDFPLVTDLIERWQNGGKAVLVPRCGDRRGHPTFFRWMLAERTKTIPANRGLDWLLESHAMEVDEYLTDRESVLTDLDSPADYERLKQQFAS